jgi:O-antigen/teichoic acid export membrane protein
MISNTVRRIWAHFRSDNLFRNSVYLMLTTGIMGIFGFFFWLIATHIFTPDEIGVGTTLISAMTLISFVSLLGFNSTFVRVLPTSQNRDNEINTGSVLVIGSAALLAILYTWIAPTITPALGIVHQNVWYAFGFVAAVALASINSLTDSIFIAYRSAEYNLITDGVVMGGTKLLLPFVFVALGAYGVFAAAGLAASLGMVASIIFLVVKFDYHPQIKISGQSLKDVFHYSFTNYLANLINIAPTLVLPIIVINNLGASVAGAYYLAFMVINLLYTVAVSVSQSLFAEGSYDEHDLKDLLKHSVKILAIIMIPAALVLGVLGPFVLAIFGKSYSNGASGVIMLLALASPAVAAFSLGSSLLRIVRKTKTLIFINCIYTAIILGLSLLWIHNGLIWVAIAWTIGNVVAAVLSFLFLYYGKR